MAKEAGLGDRLFVNGYDLSGDVGSIQTLTHTIAEQDVTGINKSATERLQLLRDGELSFATYFTGDTSDTNNEHAHERLRNLATSANCTYFRGTTQGGAGAGLVCNQFQYQLARGQDGSLLGSVNAKVSGGVATEWGYILDVDAVRTSAGNQTNGLDLGASHGIDDMAFYLHATAFTGTSVTLIIQQDDNSGFSSATTYGSFTAVSAAHSYQRLEVAGAPERYNRWRANAGTFSSVTFSIVAAPLYD